MDEKKIFKKQMEIAEEIFGTETDPDQIPVNQKSVEKFNTLCDSWLETEFNDKGEPIAWVVVLPTQKKLAEKFLNKEITERELLNLTKPGKFYNALYLASAITVPKHRRKGLATKLFKKAISNAPVSRDAFIFAWPWSREGHAIIEPLAQALNRKIKTPSTLI